MKTTGFLALGMCLALQACFREDPATPAVKSNHHVQAVQKESDDSPVKPGPLIRIGFTREMYSTAFYMMVTDNAYHTYILPRMAAARASQEQRVHFFGRAYHMRSGVERVDMTDAYLAHYRAARDYGTINQRGTVRDVPELPEGVRFGTYDHSTVYNGIKLIQIAERKRARLTREMLSAERPYDPVRYERLRRQADACEKTARERYNNKDLPEAAARVAQELDLFAVVCTRDIQYLDSRIEQVDVNEAMIAKLDELHEAR